MKRRKLKRRQQVHCGQHCCVTTLLKGKYRIQAKEGVFGRRGLGDGPFLLHDSCATPPRCRAQSLSTSIFLSILQPQKNGVEQCPQTWGEDAIDSVSRIIRTATENITCLSSCSTILSLWLNITNQRVHSNVIHFVDEKTTNRRLAGSRPSVINQPIQALHTITIIHAFCRPWWTCFLNVIKWITGDPRWCPTHVLNQNRKVCGIMYSVRMLAPEVQSCA